MCTCVCWGLSSHIKTLYHFSRVGIYNFLVSVTIIRISSSFMEINICGFNCFPFLLQTQCAMHMHMYFLSGTITCSNGLLVSAISTLHIRTSLLSYWNCAQEKGV